MGECRFGARSRKGSMSDEERGKLVDSDMKMKSMLVDVFRVDTVCGYVWSCYIYWRGKEELLYDFFRLPRG